LMILLAARVAIFKLLNFVIDKNIIFLQSNLCKKKRGDNNKTFL